jgi:site-specific recombinase XerD
MKTTDALELYMSTKRLSPYTKINISYSISKLTDWLKSTTGDYELPETAYTVNKFLTSLNLSDSSIWMIRKDISTIYKYLIDQMDFPNFTHKIMKIKQPKKQRRYLKENDLAILFQKGCKTPLDKALFLVCYDSPCREGELGRHPKKDGTFYPGLRVEMLSDPFIITDSEGNAQTVCEMTVEGKTGQAKYRLHPDIRNLLLSIAAPNGQIFTTRSSPEGMSSHAISCMFRDMFLRAGLGGQKLGPHTLRHSAAYAVAKKTGSVLTVMSLLQQSETKSAMIYIHDANDELKYQVSPLKMLGNTLKTNNQTNIQPLMITDATESKSTELAVINTEVEVEKVEGEIDLSEELFPEIPDNCKTINPHIKARDLQTIRKAFVYYTKHAPLNGISGQLSQIMKTWLRKTQIK